MSSKDKLHRDVVNDRRRNFGMSPIEGDYLPDRHLNQNMSFSDLPGAPDTEDDEAREKYFDVIGGSAEELYRRTGNEDYETFVQVFYNDHIDIREEDWDKLRYPVQMDFFNSAQQIYNDAKREGILKFE